MNNIRTATVSDRTVNGSVETVEGGGPLEMTSENDARGLEVRNVSLSYATSRGPLQALSDISFSVPPGRFACLLGPSGCGKSTLLKLAAGLLSPSSGELVVGGRKVTAPRRDVGIVFQQPTLLPWRTVLQNVLAPFDAVGRPSRAEVEKARDVLSLVKLDGFAEHYPHELSGGMQQRVGIARSLVHEPALLLMDEPFAALDALTREHMMQELQALWMARPTAVLFITHSIPEAVFLADDLYVLSPRPARVLESHHIDLPRPRTMETMGTSEFVAHAAKVRGVFDSIDVSAP